MMKDASQPDTFPGIRLVRLALFVGAFLVALALLYVRAEAVAPAAHFAYTQNLRDLRDIDARLDNELLSNRLALARNYDGLTDYTALALAKVEMVLEAPVFLSRSDQIEIAELARQLKASLQQKAERIDHFKRNDAVLRNSLAYFPVFASELLDQSPLILQGALRVAVGQYARKMLDFSRAPDRRGQEQLALLKNQLVAQLSQDRHPVLVENLLRHGDVISGQLFDLDELTESILAIGSSQQLNHLNRHYQLGHGNALTLAGYYRVVLYVLLLLLASYLLWTFLRLERTRRSLVLAHGEVSTRYAAQLVAEKSLKLHATAFRSAHDGITLTDASGNILEVNPAFSRITGWERSEVIGRNPRVLKSGRHDREFYQAMWKSINETGNWRGEIWNRNKYGEVYPELLSISAVNDEVSGNLTNYVAVFADIGRIKAQERQLTQMAYFDALTELPNRSLLADRLDQAIAQTRRSTELLAVCYLDLDGFKPINDTWGHDAGDRVLVEIANRLKDALRGGDTVARMGGDEFALLLLGLGSVEECDEALKRILQLIAKPLACLPEPVAVSASIGVTLFPIDGADPDTLMRHADQAMYQAKQAGKNSHHVFDAELDRSARSRFDRMARIHQALDDGEFLLYYQPKVDMRKGCVVGVEALIRWNHPERGIVPPIEFLPMVEDDELIILIGDWVIGTALAQMEEWLRAGLNFKVSVNVAARQMQAHDFVEKLKTALQRHPAVSRNLELEALETAALEDVAKTSRVIEECRELGVEFSLDDFGTGYSSLTYLKRLPADTIKIDQSFVREILNDQNNLVIVQGVIGMARAFQRKVIAEGVETIDHGRLLMMLNCDQAQGYGVSKPMPADQVVSWVQSWRPDPVWQEIRSLYWQEADYPLFNAEVEHRNWVAQLVYAAQEAQPVPQMQLCSNKDCRFGRWYHGSGHARYAQSPAFVAIDEPHARVHDLALRIDQLWRDGHVDDARAQVPKLLAARDDVLLALRELQRAVAVNRQTY